MRNVQDTVTLLINLIRSIMNVERIITIGNNIKKLLNNINKLMGMAIHKI